MKRRDFISELAKSFAGMTEAVRQRLIAKVTDLADGKAEYFKRPGTA
jgi:hypothetical protein